MWERGSVNSIDLLGNANQPENHSAVFSHILTQESHKFINLSLLYLWLFTYLQGVVKE